MTLEQQLKESEKRRKHFQEHAELLKGQMTLSEMQTVVSDMATELADLRRLIVDEIQANSALRQLEKTTLEKINKYLDDWV